MKTKIFLFATALFLALIAGGFWILRNPPAQPRVPASTPAETIASSGEILGLAIGSEMSEARTRLDALRIPSVYTPDAKEKSGRRIYWKLRETEFDWVMAWAGADGKISRLRAVYRPEKSKPFREIGDLATAASVTSDSVKWNLRRPGGPYYRLIAHGPEQKARTVYMFSLAQPDDGSQAPEPEEEDD